MQKSKVILATLIVSIALTGSVAAAAWSASVWHNPDSWIVDGGVISARKVGENLKYLLWLSGSNCSVHNNGATRYNNTTNTIQYCNSSGWVSI